MIVLREPGAIGQAFNCGTAQCVEMYTLQSAAGMSPGHRGSIQYSISMSPWTQGVCVVQ